MFALGEVREGSGLHSWVGGVVFEGVVDVAVVYVAGVERWDRDSAGELVVERGVV